MTCTRHQSKIAELGTGSSCAEPMMARILPAACGVRVGPHAAPHVGDLGG
jgi:hypothetical protein